MREAVLSPLAGAGPLAVFPMAGLVSTKACEFVAFIERCMAALSSRPSLLSEPSGPLEHT